MANDNGVSDCELAEIREEIRILKRDNRRVHRFAATACVCIVGFLSLAAATIPNHVSWSTYLNLKPGPLSLRKQVVTQPTGNVIQVTEIQILNAQGGQVGLHSPVELTGLDGRSRRRLIKAATP